MAKRIYGKTPKLFGLSVLHPLNLVLIVNVSVWILLLLEGGRGVINYYFGLNPSLVIERKMFWQVFTYGFLHNVSGDFLMKFFHIGMNMLGLYTLGFWICRYMNEWKFLALYLIAQLGGGICVVLFAYSGHFLGIVAPDSVWDSYRTITIGASGGVFGVLAVFGLMFPEAKFAFPPVKAKNAAWVLIGFGYLFDMISYLSIVGHWSIQFAPFPVSNSGHLGGAVFGISAFYVLFDRKASLPKPHFIRQEEDRPKEVRKKLEDPFEEQIRKNRDLLGILRETKDKSEQEKILSKLQAKDTNLCPPPTFNTEDPFCLRCDWLPNCALRKLKEESR
ncbi:rhomboid family intramembrane serine protease [Leptospira perolatii]|uniref:Rhomboid family intramembrane serine protease n=1 Tax=Leptospira perolatii TaxID=2023191 RepID=A0A2M9ZQU8_9LEPT|nr:rhomboid family intramembrane serine protease [Leptospira perolatii]PJZ69066.1 rhomboid family intramembrane serine protease [Leptospira perolatii]PJZ74448.1 rhomboid family intramembrane serine protease [Leptospira perolatii]